ncbi:endonuclease/exonuclease/phosphatase family protein [Streptosporangium carneum]|uniref:Endonuclease n=1 Tax=Streptosporangium carneum TaxID=47481 RepID=A0A9W6MDB9_9ACTN|nr:endonuclease/exonuclease/phosphatase family protein [Streptosporangium carneum]GLK10344.1 endonuclease [Streptosporangium carneum]
MIKSTWMSVLVWLLLAPFTAWAALRITTWIPTWQWIALIAFTPYVAAASAVPLLLALGLRRWAASAVALATSVTLAAVVLPRHFTDGNPPAGDQRLRVLASNLAVGAGETASLMKLVRALDPDVLTLQELTPDALKSLERAGLRELMPYAVDRSRGGGRGSGIYSKHPLSENPMIEQGGFRQARAVLRHPGGREIEVVSVHPCALRYDSKVPCWSDGLEALPRGGDRLRVLAGDFNATLDHPPMRALLEGGYRDAADVTGRGLTPTWPQQGWQSVPGVTIDHVLADSRIAVDAFSVHALPGTDHRPVFAELTLPR